MRDAEKCPTCHGAGRVILDGFAPRIDVAYLEQELPPEVWVRLASRLRQLAIERGSARITLALDVRAGEVAEIRPDWGETYRPHKTVDTRVEKGAR